MINREDVMETFDFVDYRLFTDDTRKILSHGYAISYTDDISKLKNADKATYKIIDGERRTKWWMAQGIATIN